MDQLKQNLPHIIIAAIVIVAVCVLALQHIITGGQTLSVIIGVAGFSMGGGVASTSLSTVAAAMPAVSSSIGNSTMTIRPSVHETQPTPPTAT